MKTGTFLIICLISLSINTYGQNFGMIILVNRIPTKIICYEKMGRVSVNAYTAPQTKINAPGLITPAYDQAYDFQKSSLQKSNGRDLINGTSLHSYRNKYTPCPELALTSMVIMAGTIPYFINSLRNKYPPGLKLTCQKTSFGAPNKACKKVTSLTFSIPVGK